MQEITKCDWCEKDIHFEHVVVTFLQNVRCCNCSNIIEYKPITFCSYKCMGNIDSYYLVNEKNYTIDLNDKCTKCGNEVVNKVDVSIELQNKLETK